MTLEECQLCEENGDRPTIKLTTKTGVVFEFECEVISTRLAAPLVTIALEGEGFCHDVALEDLEAP